jgi:hypothetical protein
VRIQRLRPKLIAVRLAVVVLVLTVAASSSHAASTPPVLRLDLKTQKLGGRPILGQTTGAVLVALGRPAQRTQGPRRARFSYGAEGRWSAIVLFRREGGTLRSWSVAFTDRRLQDATLGTPLHLQPRQLQRRLVAELGLRVVRPYRCTTTCRGDVAFPGTGVRVGFGRVGTRRPPYLVLYDAL